MDRWIASNENQDAIDQYYFCDTDDLVSNRRDIDIQYDHWNKGQC